MCLYRHVHAWLDESAVALVPSTAGFALGLHARSACALLEFVQSGFNARQRARSLLEA